MSAQTIKCAKCGKRQANIFKFCEVCGTPLFVPAPQSATTSKPDEQFHGQQALIVFGCFVGGIIMISNPWNIIPKTVMPLESLSQIGWVYVFAAIASAIVTLFWTRFDSLHPLLKTIALIPVFLAIVFWVLFAIYIYLVLLVAWIILWTFGQAWKDETKKWDD
jgi:hypothetical protein